MNGKPRVSVVIPVFNGAAHLPDAFASVLSQTLADFELIVVDDGSTDGASQIISDRARRDRRIVPFRQENRGLPAARNAGLELARADVVAFLDADDVWLPKKLERQLAYLDQNPGCDACFTYFEAVDDELRIITPWNDLQEKWGRATVGPELLVERGNLVAGSASSVVARTAALREAGGFDERLVACEDLDLWYRLALRAPLHAVPEVLVRIRRSAGQMQSDFSRVLVGRIQFLENVRRQGDERHSQLARGVERRMRTQLLRRSLRRGQLRRVGAQAFGLLFSGRAMELR
jgi:GT2 family glycosyltransferase